MTDVLGDLDRHLLHLLNGTLANPVGDLLWPMITHYDRFWPVRIVLIALWILLIVRGGRRGRTAALLAIPLLVVADQVSSSVLKPLFDRPRPCHLVGGTPVVPGLRMLVDCGPGMAFPSSHAVNNFAVATFFSLIYRRLAPWLFAWAALVALSRPSIGVHYPSDIIGGAAIGMLLAFMFVGIYRAIESRAFPGGPARGAGKMPA